MERFTTSDGIGIAFARYGEDRHRPAVVLHHGFAASAARNWVAPGVVAALVAAGRRVVALDARGHGDSDKPHDPRFYGEDRMARDLTELLDHLGEPSIDLVGYSMGGIVALIAATREPRLRRLIVGGIGGAMVARDGTRQRPVDAQAIAAALLADDLAPFEGTPALAFRRFADATGADRRALAAHMNAPRAAAAIPLARIAAPTLVLVGADDALATQPEVLAAAIPGARLLRIPGDHLTAVRDPHFAPAIVAFLAEE